MKKTILSIIAIVCLAMSSYAQTLVATLTHGDSISQYYGGFAFRDALNAATNGDVINLSGGSFQMIDITKAVSIRGTGTNDPNPTYLMGAFVITIPDSVTEKLNMEGCVVAGTMSIGGTLSNACFVKNEFKRIHVPYVSSPRIFLNNITFLNCNILSWSSTDCEGSAQFMNCFVGQVKPSDEMSTMFLNCVITSGTEFYNDLSNCQLSNSILIERSSFSRSLDSSCSAINCIAIGNDKQFGETARNCSYATMSVFQDSDYMKDLTDDAKDQYIGTDGTPIGMYGGIMPYDPTPTYPRITKMNVAGKTTADGKLSVEIEVNAIQ